MTDIEIDQHKHPEKYLSDAEKLRLKQIRYPPLTSRQFHLTLVKHQLDDVVKRAIDAIADTEKKL